MEATILLEFKKDDSWLHEQLEHKEFLDKYENKFVAVKDRKVIASAKTIDRLIEELESSNIDVAEVFVEFIYPKGLAVFF